MCLGSLSFFIQYSANLIICGILWMWEGVDATREVGARMLLSWRVVEMVWKPSGCSTTCRQRTGRESRNLWQIYWDMRIASHGPCLTVSRLFVQHGAVRIDSHNGSAFFSTPPHTWWVVFCWIFSGESMTNLWPYDHRNLWCLDAVSVLSAGSMSSRVEHALISSYGARVQHMSSTRGVRVEHHPQQSCCGAQITQIGAPRLTDKSDFQENFRSFNIIRALKQMKQFARLNLPIAD